MEELVKSIKLIEDDNGDALCWCNMCGNYLIDHNPQIDAKRYESSIANGELKQLVDMTHNDMTHNIEYLWACPHCLTDGYLTDFLPDS